MERIQITKYPSDKGWLRHRRVSEDDYDLVIDRPAALYNGDQLVAVYRPLDDAAQLIPLLRDVRYQKQKRTNGMSSQSKVFGFSPRIAIRHNYCRAAMMVRQEPECFAALMGWSQQMSDALKESHPAQWERQAEQVKVVCPAWQMPGSVFTSGIVNQTSELTYHYDAGNFHGAWSCMMTFSYDTEGGNLVFPDYRIALSVEENRLFMFNGSELLHGVSHIKKRTSRAYRYSVVFYALEAMKHCLEPCEEVKRARQSDIVRARRTPEERLMALRGGLKD